MLESGFTSHVRSDHGIENSLVVLMMNIIRGLSHRAHIKGNHLVGCLVPEDCDLQCWTVSYAQWRIGVAIVAKSGAKRSRDGALIGRTHDEHYQGAES